MAQLAVAFDHACALRRVGTVACWGWAMDGEMGDGFASHPSCTGAPCASTPVDVSGISDAIAISGTWTHTCALRKGGTAVCWGDDRSGEIGDGPGSDTCQNGACRQAPAAVNGVSGLSAIAAGAHFTLFLNDACEVWGTGLSSYANLGAGDTTSHDAPVRATVVVP